MVRTLIVISTLVVHMFAQPAANPNQPPPGGGQQKPAEPPKKKSMEEALKNKQWSEQQFHISLRIYQCDKGYWHLTSENT